MEKGPTIEELRTKVSIFGSLPRPDASYAAFLAATAPALDCEVEAHREALFDWLNRWGCRIGRPRPGEDRPFDQAVPEWWAQRRTDLPTRNARLSDLADDDVTAAAAAFDDLRTRVVARSVNGRTRTMGPTAASKALYAIRPLSLMPWDEAIGIKLHGGRDGKGYAAHLRMGRVWASDLLHESRLNEDDIVSACGRSGVSLAKLLDEYCYVTYTLER